METTIGYSSYILGLYWDDGKITWKLLFRVQGLGLETATNDWDTLGGPPNPVIVTIGDNRELY